MYIPWSKEEKEFLIKYYNSHKSKFCAKHLKRTRCAIKTQASKLLLRNQIKDNNKKICLKCYQNKELYEFSPHKLAKDGLQPKCKKCRAKWESNRKKTNLTYRMIHSLRNRIRIAIKKNVKQGKSLNLLGCSIEFFKEYISKKFTNGMTWDNWGKWHLDHIIPCCQFDLSKLEEQQKCFHYTNMQPLWAKDNLSKAKKCNEIKGSR